VRDLDTAGGEAAGQGQSMIVYAFGDPPQPVRPVVDRVHPGHHGQQHLGRADVAGGLLPADVLLAGLQGEPVGRRPVGVLGHPHESSGQRPLEPGPHREVAGVRPAEAERHPEPLGGPGRDVRPDLAGRPQQRQREQVGRDGDQRAHRVRRLDQGGVVPHRTGNTRVLQVKSEIFGRKGVAGVEIHELEADPERLRPRAQDGQRLRKGVGVHHVHGRLGF
jgi:hypothetical protein